MLTRELITTKQLCEELDVTRQTVQRWVKRGIPYVKVGLQQNKFDIEAVMKWFEEQRK